MRFARALLLAILAAPGCEFLTSPADSLVVEGSVQKSTVVPGQDPLRLDLTITNRGDEPVDVMLEECNPPFIVTTALRKAVGPGPDRTACYLLVMIAPTTIQPHSSVHYTSQWYGESLEAAGPRDERHHVPAGRYFIQPRVQVLGAHSGHATGTPVSITVAAPASDP